MTLFLFIFNFPTTEPGTRLCIDNFSDNVIITLVSFYTSAIVMLMQLNFHRSLITKTTEIL